MSDILRETWAYQEIMKEGELRASIKMFWMSFKHVSRRYSSMRRSKSRALKNRDIETLNVKMSIAQTAEEALQYLFTVDKKKEKPIQDMMSQQ